jgi:asparagine synthase (glutamine-hydrolysing)
MPPLQRSIDWVTFGRRLVRAGLYGPALRDRVDPSRLISDAYGMLGGVGVNLDETEQIAGGFMRLDQEHWLPDDVLAKADRATMLVSLEMRTPFLHRELAELAANAPIARLVRGRGKALVRDVLQAVLPEADVKRSKTAFRTPAAAWLRGPLGPQLHQLETGPLCEEGWFEPAALRNAIEDHASGRDMSHVLWPSLALGLWLDRLRNPGSG